MRSNPKSTEAPVVPIADDLLGKHIGLRLVKQSLQGTAHTALAALELGLHPEQGPFSVRVAHRHGSCSSAVLGQRGGRRWRAGDRLLGAAVVPLPLPDGRCRQSPIVQRIMDEHLRRRRSARVVLQDFKALPLL